jgi:hypothetical protein
MARAFAITAASEQVTLDDKGNGEITYTVSNTTTKPLRAWPELKCLGSTADTWVSVVAGGERSFSPGESQQFVVKITVPGGTSAGKYSFRLNMISGAKDTDEESVEGPATAFEIKVAPVEPTKGGFPWWIVIVIAVVLVGGGLAIWLILPSKKAVPNVVGKQITDASNLLAQAEFRLEVTESLATGTNKIGVVIRQDPQGGAKAGKDSLIKLAVEREIDKVRVPLLIGLPPGRIRDLFGSLALKFTPGQEEFTGTQSPGAIAKQNPPAGQSVDPGATVTYTVEAKKPEAPTPPYVGNWANENSQTRGITRFDIRQQNGKLFVHMWGKCHPTDCDWGEMEARPSGSTRLLITWDQGFVVRSQTLTFENQRIRLESRSNFKDGRPPQTSTETFKKRELFIIRDFLPTIRAPLLRNP